MKRNQFFSNFFYFAVILSFVLNNAYASLRFSNQASKFSLENGATFGLQKPIQSWTGTLDIQNGGNLSGSYVNFNNGYLNNQTSKSELTGTYNPVAAQQVQLNGNQALSVDKGTFLNSINVFGAGNKIQGTPQFSNANAIRLENNNTNVTLALQNIVNSNIILRGGSVILANDLNFADDRTFTGSGTVFLKRTAYHLEVN